MRTRKLTLGPHNLARRAKVLIFKGEFGRDFDRCFEEGNGDAVVGCLCKEVCVDRSFRHKVIEHRERIPAVVVATAMEMMRVKHLGAVKA